MAEQTSTIAAHKLDELLRAMGVEATITVVSEDPAQLEVTADGAAQLIGHRGEGMRSLQHLLRLMLVKEGRDEPVLVDIEGYRAQQQDNLVDQAKRKADEVAQSGRLAVMSPMSSYERRLVHMALAERPDVVTESLGEGRDRRVMIKKAA